MDQRREVSLRDGIVVVHRRSDGKEFKGLPELLQKAFARYGITESDWDVIRRAPLIERGGAKYIKPGDILELARGEVKGLSQVFSSEVSTLRQRKSSEATGRRH